MNFIGTNCILRNDILNNNLDTGSTQVNMSLIMMGSRMITEKKGIRPCALEIKEVTLMERSALGPEFKRLGFTNSKLEGVQKHESCQTCRQSICIK